MRWYVAQWGGSWAAHELGACCAAVLLDAGPSHSTLHVSLEPMPPADLRRELGHRTVQPWSKESRMRLARPLTCLLAVGSVVLIVACVHALMRRTDRGPLYSVATVQAGLAHHPAAWVGRVVEVRGIAVRSGCQSWPSPEITSCRGGGPGVLVDRAWLTILPLTLEASTPLPPLLRRLPLPSQWVPPPQAVRWGVVATYRVQLRAAHASSCASPPCYQAVLLDAAP
jgi:hypothetical protein